MRKGWSRYAGDKNLQRDSSEIFSTRGRENLPLKSVDGLIRNRADISTLNFFIRV